MPSAISFFINNGMLWWHADQEERQERKHKHRRPHLPGPALSWKYARLDMTRVSTWQYRQYRWLGRTMHMMCAGHLLKVGAQEVVHAAVKGPRLAGFTAGTESLKAKDGAAGRLT